MTNPPAAGDKGRRKPDASPVKRILTGLAVTALILLAVGLRAYRLDRQPLWYDDYNGYICLEEPGFSAYWDCVRNVHSEHMPLYFLVNYLWSQCAGPSPTALRALSILFGAVSVPLLFLLAREIYGVRAGLVAALCLALSPMHVFHSQGIRPYSFLALLCLLSILALVRALRGDGRAWWVVNAVVNLLVIWTHLFGGLVVFVEGVFLFMRLRPRKALLWALVHLVLLAPCLGWVYTMPPMPGDAYALYHRPTALAVLTDLAGDDAVHLNLELLPAPRTWSFLPERAALAFLGAYPFFDLLLIAFYCLCVAVLLWKRVRGSETERQDGDAGYTALLLLLFLVPTLGLAVLSWVWKPCIFPRYTLYSSMALYVMVGGAFAYMRTARVRHCALATLVGLYVYQLSLLAPAPTRTEWYDAGALVTTHASRGDVIIAGKFPGAARPIPAILRRHLDGSPLAVVPGDSPQDICRRIACYCESGLCPPERRVWVVLEREYAMGPLPELEECLTSRGFQWERTDFYAMEGLSVYRVSPDFDPVSVPTASATERSCPDALTELARAFIEARDLEAAGHVLDAFFQSDPAAVMVYGHLAKALENGAGLDNALAALDLVLGALRSSDTGDWEGASDALHRAAKLAPAYSAPHVALALRFLAEGDTEGCLDEMRKAFEAEPDQAGQWKGFITAFLEEGDYERAWSEAERLHGMHVFLPQEFLDILRTASGQSR